MNAIPFCDLHRSNKPIRKEIERAIADCIDRSSFLRGRQTHLFEEEWACYCGQKYAVCCNSGTDALTLAAMAMGLKTATIPANTLPLTGTGLHRGSVEVQIAEINSEGWLISPAEDNLPVLIFGRLPEPGSPVARLYDAAHAHGWKPFQGTNAAWSFYPTKSLGAMGDAGAVTTDDESLAMSMRELCGRDDRLHDRRQITSRIDEIQAAILRIKLRHLPDWLGMRQEIAQQYNHRLHDLGITISGKSLYHLYVIRVKNRDCLMTFLKNRGIGCKVHWESPLNKVPGPWMVSGSFQEAENWCESILSLPCFPGLTSTEINFVCDAIEEFYS